MGKEKSCDIGGHGNSNRQEKTKRDALLESRELSHEMRADA